MKLNRLNLFAALLVTIMLTLVALTPAASTAAKRAHIVILGTTDLHGNLFPIDYYTDKADNRGLAKIASLIKQVRKETPNVMLVDSGDTIQGTPLQYYHNKKNNQ